MLDPGRAGRVAQDIAGFVERIAAAGAINGLSQTLLRMTTPGIPDLYQGDEFWDFSLVDPDNRRPVDYPARIAALAAGEAPARLLEHWRDGRVKQAIVARTLGFRAARPELFASGSYRRLEVTGPGAERVFAFARQRQRQVALVVVTRLAAGAVGAGSAPLVPAAEWGETMAVLPRNLRGRETRDVLGSGTDGRTTRLGELWPIGTALARLPVGLFELM
jgi:(1->4)-alpha-D-glucan 1-alpha-D-glucosylmutase